MNNNIIKVTNSKDSGSGSLRDAIIKATDNLFTTIIIKNINLIILTTGELKVQSNIKIICKNNLVIGTSGNRLFHIYPSVNIFEVSGICGKSTITLSGGTSDYGGAIFNESTTCKLIAHNLIIKDNIATIAGGGICSFGDITLISCLLKSNKAGSQGAGIYCAKNVNIINTKIKKNIVTNINSSSSGAGVYVDFGTVKMCNSYICKNEVTYGFSGGGSGGGLTVMVGDIYLVNSHIDNNSAFNSGGIQAGKSNIFIIQNSTVNYNQSFNTEIGAGGGGIVIIQGSVYVKDSEISHNKTVGMYSGGIVTLVADVIIENSVMTGNSNRGPGGAIAINVGSVTVLSSNISKNTGASLGGAIVNFSPSPGVISISSTKICENILTNAQTISQTIEAFLRIVAENLASIESQALAGPSIVGGTILVALIPSVLNKITSISDKLNLLPTFNNLIAGGAIASLLITPINIQNSIIYHNFAGKNVSNTNFPFSSAGGGIFGYGSAITIQNSKILKNLVLTEGAGIWSNTSLNVNIIKIQENVILDTDTKDGQYGAGIYNSSVSSATITNSEVNCNVVKNGTGAGIYNLGKLSLFTSKIEHNIANLAGGIYSIFFINLENCVKDNKPDNIVIV